MTSEPEVTRDSHSHLLGALEGLTIRAHRTARRAQYTPSERPALFLHIPRCAGTSLKKEFRIEVMETPRLIPLLLDGRPRVLSFDHLPVSWLLSTGLITDRLIRDSTIFTVVRNPFTRAESHYRQLLKRGVVQGSNTFVSWLRGVQRIHRETRANFPAPPSLTSPESEWISSRRPNMRWMIAAWPQVTWTEGLPLDIVGKFENLALARAAISRAIGRPMNEISTNSSSNYGPSLEELYSEEAEELVREIYSADFVAFGYSLNRSIVESNQKDGTTA
jgi:hypothetical protein